MPAAPRPDEWVLRERQRIGEQMRRLRRARGLTQEQLAERTGLDNKTISRAENAVHPIPLDHLLMIARGIGVRLVDLVAE